MKCLTGFIMWISFFSFIVSCFSKEIPVKRRFVLRLPFVNRESQYSGPRALRPFVLGTGDSSKIKKAASNGDNIDWPRYIGKDFF